MFCRKCGKYIEGEAAICDACAGTQQTQAAPSQFTQQTPVSQFTQNEPAPQEPVFDLNSYDEPAPAKKKGGKGKFILIGVAVAAVAAIVALVLNWTNLFGGGKNYGSPAEQLSYVEKEALGKITDTFSEAYGTILGSAEDSNVAADLEMHLNLNTDFIGEFVFGDSLDLSWASDILLNLDTNTNGSRSSVTLGLGLGSTEAAAVQIIMDEATMEYWIGFPGINDQYLYMNMLELYGEAYATTMMTSMGRIQDLMEVLPSEQTVNQLLDKYLGIVLSGITNVEKSTETVEVNGVKQELTVLTAKITEKDLLNIAINVLEEAQKDQALKSVIVNFSDCYNDMAKQSMREYLEYYGETYEEEDLYAYFTEAVAEGLESLRSIREDCDDGNYLLLKDYVNSSDEIVGRKFSLYSGNYSSDEVGYITVEQGDKFAFEADFVEVTASGDGTVSGGKYNGEFDLTVGGSDMLYLELKDFATNGESGSIILYPSYALLEAMDAPEDVASMILSMDLGIELAMTGPETVEINVLTDHELLVGLSMLAKDTVSGTITTPSSVLDAYSATQNEIMDWLANTDIDRLVRNLKAAGVPAEYADVISQAFSQLLAQVSY